MVTKHVGGEFVRGGVYWSSSNWEFIFVPEEGTVLAGGPRDRYFRTALPVVMVLGPLMGLAFFVFLPLSGLLVLVPFLAHRVHGAMAARKVSVAHVAASGLQPGVSYLESRPAARSTEWGRQAEAPDQVQDGKLVDLAREIAEKRWQER